MYILNSHMTRLIQRPLFLLQFYWICSMFFLFHVLLLMFYVTFSPYIYYQVFVRLMIFLFNFFRLYTLDFFFFVLVGCLVGDTFLFVCVCVFVCVSVFGRYARLTICIYRILALDLHRLSVFASLQLKM